MEVIGIGTASVSHQANTHAVTANMFRLVVGPSKVTQRQITAHKRGPNRMQKFLSVAMDLSEKGGGGGDDGWLRSLTGRNGVLGSSYAISALKKGVKDGLLAQQWGKGG